MGQYLMETEIVSANVHIRIPYAVRRKEPVVKVHVMVIHQAVLIINTIKANKAGFSRLVHNRFFTV